MGNTPSTQVLKNLPEPLGLRLNWKQLLRHLDRIRKLTRGIYERSIAYCIVYKWLFEVSQTISRQRPPLCCFCLHNLSEYLNCLRTWITAGYFISILTNANITNILLFLENHEPGAPLFIFIWCWTIWKTKRTFKYECFYSNFMQSGTNFPH